MPYKEKARTNSMELTDLRESDRYEFRVIAENNIGPSKPSESSTPFTAKSKYGMLPFKVSYQMTHGLSMNGRSASK